MPGQEVSTIAVAVAIGVASRARAEVSFPLSEIGLVFQSFHLLPALDLRDNVALPHFRLHGDRRSARTRAESLLSEVGLAERGHHYPSQLSGGEQQRVALARAFGPRPALLLADEPTGNLDGATGKIVLDLLVGMRANQGATLIVVTHDPAVAELADRRIHLLDGRIVREESA